MIIGSLGMITSRQTVMSSVSFLLAMVALSGMFALLGNAFLFLAQLLVAVGAVVTLALLVIVSVNVKEENLPKEPARWLWSVTATALVIPFVFLMFNAIDRAGLRFADVGQDFGNLKAMGMHLFSAWVLPFELVSLLLLAAMVGAIVITKKEERNDA